MDVFLSHTIWFLKLTVLLVSLKIITVIRYIASITKKLSRLVHLDQNKKNKILGRLNEVYNKPTNNLEVDETSFSVERSGNGDFGDFVSVKYKYSIFSALFGCFFKGLKRVFPLN